jgi:MoxR-like ATPase
LVFTKKLAGGLTTDDDREGKPMTVSYEPILNLTSTAAAEELPWEIDSGRLAQRQKKTVYVYTEETKLAVNVALATERPLLLRGPAGSGKSSLAENVAKQLGWRYLEYVTTSRSQAQDLLWQFDALRRLNDAQAQKVKDTSAYLRPGKLWQAFNPHGAALVGERVGNGETGTSELNAPVEVDPASPAVVLIDEIDKADPSFPDDLLVPLDTFEFEVPDLRRGDERFYVTAQNSPLVIITTNNERALSAAFLRRCMVHILDHPSPERLVEIAEAHFGRSDRRLYQAVARRLKKVSAAADPAGPVPSTAEFLDTIRACRKLGISATRQSRTLSLLLTATLAKPR